MDSPWGYILAGSFPALSCFSLLLDDDDLDQSGGSGRAQILVYFRKLPLGNVCIRRCGLPDLRFILEQLSNFSRVVWLYTSGSGVHDTPPHGFHGSSLGFLCTLSALFYAWINPNIIATSDGSISSMQTGKKPWGLEGLDMICQTAISNCNWLVMADGVGRNLQLSVILSMRMRAGGEVADRLYWVVFAPPGWRGSWLLAAFILILTFCIPCSNALFRLWEDRAEASSAPKDLSLGSRRGAGVVNRDESVDKRELWPQTA